LKYRRRILAARRLAAATAILWPIQRAFAADTPPATDAAPVQQPLAILGKTVAPMTTELLYWTPGVAFDGNSIRRGVIVANGANPGPVLCLTAVVHGDEHNGLEIVRWAP
jgi:hypothetical protein